MLQIFTHNTNTIHIYNDRQLKKTTQILAWDKYREILGRGCVNDRCSNSGTSRSVLGNGGVMGTEHTFDLTWGQTLKPKVGLV